jgi:hypothetical protein
LEAVWLDVLKINSSTNPESFDSGFFIYALGLYRRSLSALPVRRRLERAIEVAAQVGERAQPVDDMKRPAAAGRASAL